MDLIYKEIIGRHFFGDAAFINMDYRFLIHHFECGIWRYGMDCIADIKSDFLEVSRQSEKYFPLYFNIS